MDGKRQPDNLPKKDEEWALNLSPLAFPRQRRAKCFGIIVAGVLLQVVILGVLALTVLRFRDPDIILSSATVGNFGAMSGTPGSINLTLREELVIKNRNWGEFKYENSKSEAILSYGGSTIGRGEIPSGHIQMRHKQLMMVEIEGKIEGVGSINDVDSGVLAVDSYFKLSGKVNMMKMIKSRKTGEMNCRLTISLTRKEIQDFHCH